MFRTTQAAFLSRFCTRMVLVSHETHWLYFFLCMCPKDISGFLDKRLTLLAAMCWEYDLQSSMLWLILCFVGRSCVMLCVAAVFRGGPSLLQGKSHTASDNAQGPQLGGEESRQGQSILLQSDLLSAMIS